MISEHFLACYVNNITFLGPVTDTISIVQEIGSRVIFAPSGFFFFFFHYLFQHLNIKTSWRLVVICVFEFNLLDPHLTLTPS